MSNSKEYLELKKETLLSIENDQVIAVNNTPIYVFIQEVFDLFSWAMEDKEELAKVGFDPSLIDDLAVRRGALKQAQSDWKTIRFSKKDARGKWDEKSPIGYNLRDELLQHFYYAYRNDLNLTKRVRAIADGTGHADMLQDLNDIATLGKDNPEPLTKIHFDETLLDQAAQVSTELAELLAESRADKGDLAEVKDLRDRAYTHCKNAVDELRACGQYVFRKNPKRKRGYISEYQKRKNAKYANRQSDDKTPSSEDSKTA